jgi:hypothetical protein
MRRLIWIVLALLAFQFPDAQASTFNWSYSGVYTSGPDLGGAVLGGGTLDATFISGTEYGVNSISGTANGLTVTGLSNYAVPDQAIFWPGSPQLDFFGLAFTISSGQALNLYFNGSSSGTPGGYDCGAVGYCLIGPGTPGTSGLDNGGDPLATIKFSATPVSATPLPATWSMLLIGFIGLGFISYRGTKQNQAAGAVA